MSIDNLTGLPELPEGYWWEVKSDKQIQKIIDTYIIYEYGYSVGIWSNILKDSEYKKQHWWSKKKTFVPITPYRYDAELAKEFVFTSDSFADDPVGSTLADTISPKTVLSAANRCKAKYDARHISANLTGKYPPKKLEV